MQLLRLILLAILFAAGSAFPQTQIDTFAVTEVGDTARFWAQIPANFNPQAPPALLIWWHQLGGTRLEMRDYTEFDTEANTRGWIAASHFGNNDRHWNGERPQQHCQAMLDWIRERYPFHMDSIYMIGGSMGGAAGQVWHNNNCGEHDYLIAATAGGSQILDTQLRQEQYLESGDTNRSMRAAFGGLPSERDSVAFEYHRASAIHLADTSQSMHFNSLNLPVWSTWGNSELEGYAYGDPAQIWYALRAADGAAPTSYFESDAGCHGFQCMWPPGVCDWLINFTANRFPDTLSINADEDDEYYWTSVELVQNDTVFGRYGIVKRPEQDQLDITLVNNIRRLTIDASVLQFEGNDTLRGFWQAFDRDGDPPEIIFANMPPVIGVSRSNEPASFWIYHSLSQELHIEFDQDGVYEIRVHAPFSATEDIAPALAKTHIIASAFPNPFNATAELLIESYGGSSELIIHNILGRRVALISLTLSPGTNRVRLDADKLGSGIFFALLSGSQQKPLKLVLLR